MKYRLHGANYKKIYEDFNIDIPNNVIDFSTNTNIFNNKIDAINIEELISSYPDDECIDVRKLISKKYNLNSNNLLVTNGSNEAIYIIASLFIGKKVSILQPTYPEYENALNGYDIKPNYIFDLDSNDNSYATFICNPNNPTGTYIDSNVLELYIKNNSNKHIIIDEAYIDFLSFKPPVIDVNKYKNVYILRSLTKSYNLSGIRIGYVISHIDNINELKKRQPTWSVNALAQKFAITFLNDDEHRAKTKKYYKEEVQRVIKQLRELKYEIKDTSVNFFLLKTKEDMDIIRFLLKKGIVVRHTRNHIGVEGKYIRIGIRTVEENNKLILALEEYHMLRGYS